MRTDDFDRRAKARSGQWTGDWREWRERRSAVGTPRSRGRAVVKVILCGMIRRDMSTCDSDTDRPSRHPVTPPTCAGRHTLSQVYLPDATLSVIERVIACKNRTILLL